MPRLMAGFPPAPDTQVTLANWRTSPFNRWAFHHVREIVPSADIPAEPGHVRELAAAPIDMGAVRIDRPGQPPLGLDAFLEDTSTDGVVIVHRGRVIFERYANGMTAASPHILMSVSKSMLGLLAGILADRGALALDRPVTDVLPELAATAFGGATIRHLLDMRVGLAFDEDYLATSGPIVEYRKATGWTPLGPGQSPSDLRTFLRELTKSSGPHGGVFHYVSPNTDLLGWVIERATGERYADLMADLLWKPLGAAHAAYITVDRLGAPRCAGGMCVTVRDLARVGQMLVEDGARGGRQIVPAAWIDDLVRGGDPAAWAASTFVDYYPGLPMRYRSQWYAQDGEAPLLFGLGIHGQNLYVDRRHAIVVAKVSSQALPLDAPRMALTTRAIARIIDVLARGAG